jgi:hypothetical protein
MAARLGIEPRLTAFLPIAGREGIGPSLTASKAAVLPLDDLPAMGEINAGRYSFRRPNDNTYFFISANSLAIKRLPAADLKYFSRFLASNLLARDSV